MQTPDGRQCPYYYLTAHRTTRERGLCHLLEGTADAAQWTSQLCTSCVAPDIKLANRCEHMVLHARIGRRPGHFWERKRMLIDATCLRSGCVVKDPMVGCGQCHAPLNFIVYEDPGTEDTKEKPQ